MAGLWVDDCAQLVKIADEGMNRAMTNPSDPVNIPAQLVKELRERTGAGFADCRSALVEAGANNEAAIDVLRKKGQAAAQKKAARQATEGLVGHYIHAGGKIGVLIEVNCESDSSREPRISSACATTWPCTFARARHSLRRREDVTQEILDREREIFQSAGARDGETPSRSSKKS